jgi:hypothetical protein
MWSQCTLSSTSSALQNHIRFKVINWQHIITYSWCAFFLICSPPSPLLHINADIIRHLNRLAATEIPNFRRHHHIAHSPCICLFYGHSTCNAKWYSKSAHMVCLKTNFMLPLCLYYYIDISENVFKTLWVITPNLQQTEFRRSYIR